MTDQELYDWIKKVKPGEPQPGDTGVRILRLVQILIADKTEAAPVKRRGRPPKRLEVKQGKIVQ